MGGTVLSGLSTFAVILGGVAMVGIIVSYVWGMVSEKK